MNKEDNKYYTPSIEEFYVGFEYEKFDNREASYSNFPKEFIRTNWHRFKYDLKSIRLSQLGTHLFEKTIRVKYLDQEDIESLGWVDGETRGLSGFFINPNTDDEFQMYLHDNLGDGYWYIEIYDYKADFIFRGNIKNKSELSKLMKQLNII
jgi:hypothetical protein